MNGTDGARFTWALVSLAFCLFSAGGDLSGWIAYGLIWWIGDYFMEVFA
jgi:hypothetical protein